MRSTCFACLAGCLAILLSSPASAQPAKGPKPMFVDDQKLFADFMEKLTDFAKAGKPLDHEKLVARMKTGTKAKVTPTKASDKALSPEEIYKLALPSVFIVGSVYKDKAGDWQDGVYATAWVASADGILVSNWHVFEDMEAGEVFGVVDHKGNVYPVIDVLGGDKVADVAIFRIDAKGLTPLAIADDYAPVGSWVGVLSHPGDNFYLYTTGTVTRYSTNKNDDGKKERWMGLTAEYAGGSSGSPVLNKYGAVVGMAALTLTLDSGDGGRQNGDMKPNPNPNPNRRRFVRGQPPIAPAPREKPEVIEPPKPAPQVAIQMIIKMAVPGPTILKYLGK